MSVLKTYNITFQNVEYWGKTIFSPHLALNQLIMDSRQIEDINDFTEALQLVVNGTLPQNFFISESAISVEVNPDVTKLYNQPNYSNNTPVLYSLPTNHLIEINKLWKQFLLS
ncbi:hypothetical protein GN157_10970 [Flavobacterium rakeshii]|uniref:Uncharacterized protein n=1 Tax=Flavobacterium rakeshii TaxID=1038845 RepID=A0A6N8HCM5_9FLAO|nr:hypothetical protein [Flavobacterium rakeshii]MEE1900196.1 hypothetical protein [Flavobacterium rakeshii]MUV04231.1 hypothetical protein [Flavobacterium rakeshii]